MAVGLGDIYEKLKELFTVLEKVRVNTEENKEVKNSQLELKKNHGRHAGKYPETYRRTAAYSGTVGIPGRTPLIESQTG